ncbi:hypothetical protein ACS8YF_07220, partial [Salinisphaera sp. SWV1]|uniref:hypothetical protein n=1 Tax=Salinisphaera sp. SWV1 TaxID=3454139 RepID=UPI003F85A2DC
KHNGAAHPSGRNASPPLAYFAFICGPDFVTSLASGRRMTGSLRSLRHLSADRRRWRLVFWGTGSIAARTAVCSLFPRIAFEFGVLANAVAGSRLESATPRKHNRICVNLR